MDELMDILTDIDPDVDYEVEDQLIDGKIFDSFSIITLISNISETFDIEIGPKDLIPENFNSAEAMWDMIQRIREEDE